MELCLVMAHIDHLEVDLELCDSKTNQLLANAG